MGLRAHNEPSRILSEDEVLMESLLGFGIGMLAFGLVVLIYERAMTTFVMRWRGNRASTSKNARWIEFYYRSQAYFAGVGAVLTGIGIIAFCVWNSAH